MIQPPGFGGESRTQYGALCWRMRAGEPEVLLVTSRDTGRWIIPKGWPMEGLAPEAAAAREAWEEAGAEGRTESQCIGLYAYEKALGRNRPWRKARFAKGGAAGEAAHQGRPSVTCVVAVYPLHVTDLKARYPEANQRRRKWFSAEKAAKRVQEPELQAILRDTGPLLARRGLIAAPTRAGAGAGLAGGLPGSLATTTGTATGKGGFKAALRAFAKAVTSGGAKAGTKPRSKRGSTKA